MKRLFLFPVLFAACTLAFPDKLTIKNTVGGDLDELDDFDLITKTSYTAIDGSEKTDTFFTLGDQFQLDWESAYTTARFRLDTLYTGGNRASDGGETIPSIIFSPSGFVHFNPFRYLGLAAGNNFYKYFAIPSAYLAAEDTTTKWGRLLTDSLGHDEYFTAGDVGLYTNGFSFGLTSNTTFEEEVPLYVKTALGATIYPAEAMEKALDGGINAGIKNLFDLGFTAHNITDADRKFGAFAGLTAIEDFIFNLGFYYNFTDSDFLPENRVSRSGDSGEETYEYKKQKTKYALGASAGYTFSSGLGLFADLISGLTNEYIGTIKYYDNDGTLIKTETTTIIRGETAVKYKYNSSGVLKAKRTDEFTAGTIPFYSQIRITWPFTTNVEGSLSLKLRTLLYDTSGTSRYLTIYPRLNIALPSKMGTISGGLRLTMNQARGDGITGISLPLTYTYKCKKKF